MADPTAIANPQALFAQNWDSLPSNSCAYETQIEQHLDGSEQRKSLRSKPVRRISTASLIFSSDQVAKLYRYLVQSSNGDVYMPLYSDQTQVTAGFTGGTNVPCDTRYRRFFAGSKAMIVTLETPNRAATIRVVTIQSLTDSAITTSGSITGTVPTGALVFPVIESQIILGQNASLETDNVLTLSNNLFERTNANTLPATIGAGEVPSGMASLRGLPVLDIPCNWDDVQEGVSRKGTATPIGLGSLPTLYGTRPNDTASLNFLTSDREEAWRLIQFFDSCRGSGRQFWYPHKASVANPTSVAPSSITVPDDVPLSEWTTRKLISIWYVDGSVDVRIISGAISSSGFSILTLSSALSDATLANIAYVSFASLARLGSDEMIENWETTEVLRTSFEVQSLCFGGDPTCIGQACECGSCEEDESCDDPVDPTCEDCDPGPPYKPKDRCAVGTAEVPYYYDLTQAYTSTGREPIRAADLPMPDVLYIEVRDTMVADTNHPYAQDISDELKNALFRTHELEYVGTIDRSAKSRNPYHTRVAGTSPSLSYGVRSGGELVEDSHCWEAEVEYLVGETTHTLTVRMYEEHIDQSASANGDSEYGMWGTAFVIWAWTTEITMSYTDGTPYAPFNSKTFIEEDPFVGGLYVSEASTVKRMHPKALFVAMTPTTWHSPIGSSYYSRIDRDQYRESCFEVDNGAPWSVGSAADASKNAVFGSTTGSHKQRALGALGGWTKVEFFNWACIENAAGTGMTILKPTNAGWDEANGYLTAVCDIRVDVCTPFHTGINPCDGHPDDPYQGKGGTHDAFRDNTNAEDNTKLCYGTREVSSISIDQRCVVKTTVYDSACDVYSFNCEEVPIITAFSNVRVDEYVYGDPEGDGSLRRIDFRQYVDDPDYEGQGFPEADACATQSDCWSVSPGSGTVASEAISYTVTGGKNVGFVARFSTGGNDVIDGGVTCTTTKTGSQKIGVGMRVTVTTGNITAGYLAVVNEVAGTLTLYKVTASDTLTVIDSESVTIPPGDYTLHIGARGDSISASVTGSFEASVATTDCEFDSGRPALVGLNVNGSVNTIDVGDSSWEKLTVYGYVRNKAILYSEVPLKATKGYIKTLPGGSCEEICDPDCPSCPCTTICKDLSSELSADSEGFTV